jgi:hypothetical protein
MAYLRSRGVAVKTGALIVAVGAAFLVAGPVAFGLGGGKALMAAAVAALLCLLGAAVAVLASHRALEPGLVQPALWTATVARLGIPLGIGLMIHLRGGPLADAGLLCYLLVFYPVTLTVGTALSLPDKDATMTKARRGP